MLENSQTSHRHGFTLIELMVSISVLLLLLLAVAQIVNDTQNISTASNKSLGADGESRLVFDRIAMDLAHMVRRTDVDYLLNHQAGNDSLFFYSEAPAFSVPSATTQQENSVALVGYRINSQYQLERLGKGLTWDGSPISPSTTPSPSVIFLSFTNYPVSATSVPLTNSTLLGAFSAVAPNATDTNYHVLGPDVFRFEFCYLLNACIDSTGTHQPAIYSNVPYDSRLGHTSITGIGLTDVQAFVVSLAILDATSRKVVPPGTSLGTASGLFADPSNSDLSSTPPKLPATTWQSKINSGGFAQSAGIPVVAANQVRIYQRIFPLNMP